MAPTNPDRKWILLGLTLLMQGLVFGLATYSFTFFIAPWMEEFAVPQSMLMLGVTVAVVVAGVLAPAGGLLIDRFQAKHLCLLGVFSFAGGLLLASLATAAVTVVLIFALVMPIANTFAGPLMSQTVVARAFEEQRGAALGISAIGTSVGGFLLPPLVTNLMPVIGWRMVLRFVAVLTTVVSVPIILWVFNGANPGNGVPRARESTPAYRALDIGLLLNGDVLRLAVIFFVPASLFLGVLHNLGAFAKDLALSVESAGTIVAGTAFAQAVTKIVLGRLADRFTHAYLYGVLTLATSAGILSTALANSLPTLFVGVALLGCASGGALPLVSVMTVDRFGHARFGTVLGVVLAVVSLSGLLPLVCSLVREVRGSYRDAFFALTPLIVLSIHCFVRFHKGPKSV